MFVPTFTLQSTEECALIYMPQVLDEAACEPVNNTPCRPPRVSRITKDEELFGV